MVFSKQQDRRWDKRCDEEGHGIDCEELAIIYDNDQRVTRNIVVATCDHNRSGFVSDAVSDSTTSDGTALQVQIDNGAGPTITLTEEDKALQIHEDNTMPNDPPSQLLRGVGAFHVSGEDDDDDYHGQDSTTPSQVDDEEPRHPNNEPPPTSLVAFLVGGGGHSDGFSVSTNRYDDQEVLEGQIIYSALELQTLRKSLQQTRRSRSVIVLALALLLAIFAIHLSAFCGNSVASPPSSQQSSERQQQQQQEREKGQEPSLELDSSPSFQPSLLPSDADGLDWWS